MAWKHSKMMANQHCRPLTSTTRLDKHTQLTTGLPWHHEYSRLLVQIARGPRISSQQRQTSYHRLCLILKSNSAFMWLCICVKKIGLPVMGDKLSDLVTYFNTIFHSWLILYSLYVHCMPFSSELLDTRLAI